MLTEIIPRDPAPSASLRPVGPSTALDLLILAFLSDGVARELQEITRAVGDSTHKVHARAQSLKDKGLVTWTRRSGGPARGPGASTYRLSES